MTEDNNPPPHIPEPTKADRKASYVTALLGGLPLGIGKKLRQRGYRKHFGAMGEHVDIHQQVEFIGMDKVFLGDNVELCRNVTINCWVENSKLSIGDGATIERGIIIQTLSGQIDIGAKSYLGPYICLAGPGNITIGENALIGAHSGIFANNHVFDDPNIPINQQPLTAKGITIEDDCWLGAGVRIMDGVTIGKGSVIGGGAVVTKDIPPMSVAVGVPAKVISKRGE